MDDTGVIVQPVLSAPIQSAPVSSDTAVEGLMHEPTEIPSLPVHGVIPHVKNKLISFKKLAGAQNLEWIKLGPAILALFGILVFGASFIITSTPLQSISMALAGISIVSISILLNFITPSRLIRSEVWDAASLSNIELTYALLEPLVGDWKGIYVPSSSLGTTKVFMLMKDGQFSKAFIDSGADIVGLSEDGKNCLFLTPPGYGLYSYVKDRGASFSSEGLEDEINDVLVNGLELVPKVEAIHYDDCVCVRMYGLSNSPMCQALRQKNGEICNRIGCPICSFIACMVVEGTGRRAMIGDVKLDDKAIEVTYTLL